MTAVLRCLARLLAPLTLAVPMAPPAVASSPVAPPETTTAYPARFALCDSYCALVDGKGALVTHRLFEKIDAFAGPVAIYQHHDKFGAVDRAGQTVIKPTHAALRVLGDGFMIAEDPVGNDGTAKGGVDTLYDASGKRLLTIGGINLTFGFWDGHPYYSYDAGTGQTVFLDAAGQSIASFAAFNEGRPDDFAVASPDGKRFGYIDATLHFVIRPIYRTAAAFTRDVAKVFTDDGPGLIDRQGRAIVPPGRYKSLYAWDETPLIDAFKPNQPNCGVYLRQDGKALHLPKGICPESADNLPALGYAYVHDAAGRRGTIDGHGRLRIRPAYPWLEGINPDYLAFGNDASHPTTFGIIDARGKQVLPPQPAAIATWSSGCCSSNPGVLHGVFVARTAQGVGLIDLHGHWLVPSRYQDVQVMSADLIAFETDKGFYELYTGSGQPLALTSSERPQWTGARPGEPGGLFTFVRRIDQSDHSGTSTIWLTGLADATGHVVIPADFNGIEAAGDGLWAVKVSDHGRDLFGLYDGTGNLVSKPQFGALSLPFVNGVSLAQSSDYKAALIDARGRRLASFDALFPELAHRGDGNDRVEQALDVCFDPDPTAEPGEGKAASPGTKTICASPSLRIRSRSVETLYYGAQTGDCLPEIFRRIRPVYDKAVADCSGNQCVSGAMEAFEQAIRNAGRYCAEPLAQQQGTSMVSEAVRASLTRRIMAAGADGLDAIAEDGALRPLDFTALSLGNRHAVLAVGNSGASNGPFWLFLETAKGSWQQVLADEVGYLRPLEVTTTLRNGLPVLRTQQHTSCCEHEVTFFAYDGRHYQSIEACRQLYDADQTPLLFCGDRREDSQ